MKFTEPTLNTFAEVLISMNSPEWREWKEMNRL